MTARQLRSVMKRYGNAGVLLVAAYLLLHEGWHRRRLWFLSGLALVFVLGCLLVPKRTQAPVPVAIPSFPPNTVASAQTTPKPGWQPASQEARKQLETAEQKIARYISHPPMRKIGEEENNELLSDAEEAVRASLTIEASGRGYMDLGEVQMRSNRCEEALHQFTLASAERIRYLQSHSK
jgi:hypothetical protein